MKLTEQIKRFQENKDNLTNPFSYYLSLAIANYLSDKKEFSEEELGTALYGVFNIILMAED